MDISTKYYYTTIFNFNQEFDILFAFKKFELRDAATLAQIWLRSGLKLYVKIYQKWFHLKYSLKI